MSKFITFSTAETNPDLNMVEDVQPEEVNTKLGKITVVDVRTEEEYVGELGHIPGSRLMSLDKLVDEIHNLDEDRTLIFVCRSGGRSARATALARDKGFESVYNMTGGMLLWNKMGLDTEGSSSQ